MSRTDYDCPPGLRTRSNNDREQMHSGYYPSTTFPTADRRASLGVLNHSGYTGAVGRSLGIQEREYRIERGPNRHNPNGSIPSQSPPSLSSFNHHRRSTSPPSYNLPYHPAILHDRDTQRFSSTSPCSASNSIPNITTLWWGEIEPWMDEEYAKQVCALMGWNPLAIKVPHPAPDPVTGHQANNPGFCYLTFPTAAQAASVISQINAGGNTPATMPNSTKPFVMNWASTTPTSIAGSFSQGTAVPPTAPPQQYPKEYSIFVGDLAPETSNSDLVAVFRNPVLGLRNDREPKFIRPFLSCKSAKIMLDPITGVSRGYGFVRSVTLPSVPLSSAHARFRFTDETDQQRALIEMHGLYCLSRPSM